MAVSRISGFTVGGLANGTVRIPCDGTTSVPVVLSLSVRLDRGEPAAIIPAWVGERGIFGWTTLIEDTFIAAGAPRIWHNITHTYNIVCVKGCKIKASGPPSGRYYQDGRELELTAARYNADYVLPGTKWWYVQNSVTVQCNGRARQVEYEIAEYREGSGNRADDELLAMAQAYKDGDIVRITPTGRITHRTPPPPKASKSGKKKNKK